VFWSTLLHFSALLHTFIYLPWLALVAALSVMKAYISPVSSLAETSKRAAVKRRREADLARFITLVICGIIVGKAVNPSVIYHFVRG
jgi:hypothetical protein